METTTITVRSVKLDSQGYTRRGEYFGVGGKLYIVHYETAERYWVEYERGVSYQDVRRYLKGRGKVER